MTELNIAVEKAFTDEELVKHYNGKLSNLIVHSCWIKIMSYLLLLLVLSSCTVKVVYDYSKVICVTIVVVSFIVLSYILISTFTEASYSVESYRNLRYFCNKINTGNIALTSIVHGYKQSILTIKNELTGDMYSFMLPGYVHVNDCNDKITVGLRDITLRNVDGNYLKYKCV